MGQGHMVTLSDVSIFRCSGNRLQYGPCTRQNPNEDIAFFSRGWEGRLGCHSAWLKDVTWVRVCSHNATPSPTTTTSGPLTRLSALLCRSQPASTSSHTYLGITHVSLVHLSSTESSKHDQGQYSITPMCDPDGSTFNVAKLARRYGV